MYKIIGADQKEYGPVTADELRAWIVQGRANGQTPVRAEGAAEWKPLAMFPEFATALGASRSGPIPPPLAADYTTLPADIRERDYDLDIGHCIGRAWSLVMGNFWGVLGGILIYWLVQLALNAMGQIPLVNIVVGLASLVIAGPLMGGVYSYLLKHVRGQPAQIGDIFAGFGPRFLHLFLVILIQALIYSALMIPGLVILLIGLIPAIHAGQPEAWQVLMMLAGTFIMAVPLVYLATCWIFALPLVMDKNLDFWPALELSRKMVSKHWFVMFAFLIVLGLVKIAGFIACCVGIVVSATIAWLAMLYAYEDIFGHRPR